MLVTIKRLFAFELQITALALAVVFLCTQSKDGKKKKKNFFEMYQAAEK